MNEVIRKAEGRTAPFIFAVVLPLAAALAFLPAEFVHYKRWLELGADDTALRSAALAAILSKTILAWGAIASLLALCARFIGPRALRLLSLGLSALLFAFLDVDLEVQGLTGNNVSDYLPYLGDPATFRWAGDGFDVGPGGRRIARDLVLALVPAVVLAWVLDRWVARSSVWVERGVLFGLLGFASIVLVGAPLLQRTFGAPGYLHHLNESLPWTWHATVGSGDAIMQASQARAQAVYANALPGLVARESESGQVSPPRAAPSHTPDILIVVVESLRHDGLDPETMPNLWALSKRGARFEHHYATSNASHYGLFALLFGRSPLKYFETLDARIPPTLPTKLRKWGYANHYLSCTDIRWRDMERFMGEPHFDVERFRADSIAECDRDVVARAKSLLEPGSRAPRFVLLFLMSTHFGYHYPVDTDGSAPFQPALDPPNVIDLDAKRDRGMLLNRYRNSARYIDSLVGSLIRELVLEKNLVAVTGDHGESLFDDGTIAHSSSLSEIQTRVPLVMAGPGVSSGTVRAGPTDHGDLLATLFARLFGLETDGAQSTGYPGHDLLSGSAKAFTALVHAKARAGGVDRIALVSGADRYSFRLDSELGTARFLGRLDARGRPSREPVSTIDGDRALRFFEDYLDSLKSN